MNRDPGSPGPDQPADSTSSDRGAVRTDTSGGTAVSAVISLILGAVGYLADVGAVIDKVTGEDGPGSLVPVVLIVVVLVGLAAAIGLGRHHGIFSAARLRRAALVAGSLGAGILIGHFVSTGDVPRPPAPGGPPSSAPATSPPTPTATATATPTPTPTPTSVGTSTSPPAGRDDPPVPSTTRTGGPVVNDPEPSRRVIPAGRITGPPAGSDVRKCAFVTGTARLPQGRTLILAVRNLDNDEPDRWYVQFPRGWREPSSLTSWQGVEYFPGDIGQHYEIGLFMVGLDEALAASAARRSDALVEGGTLLDTRRVVQAAGGSGSDCDRTD